MKYCRRCLYPANHPLGITFDEQGVCSGCRVHEEKDTLDWDARADLLADLLDRYRDRTGNNFDCIIPVSGARDSYFIVHTIKNIYGMTPLLVTYNKEYNTKLGIRNLDYLRTNFDCDHMNISPSPDLLKKITRKTIAGKGSIYWHVLAGTTVFPVQTAVRFGIPLIIWGAHQGIDQVGMFSHLDQVEMTRKYRKEHDLLGIEAEALIDEVFEISYADIEPFVYPTDVELESVGVRGIYLNNFIRWDSKKQHEMMIDQYGYESAHQQRTFDTYNDVDCFHYSGLHDYIKFLKHGYGKASDHASREIRLKRMTREQGIAEVKKYQDLIPTDLPLFLDWIGISEAEFFEHINQHRSPEIWSLEENGEWNLKDSVINHLDDSGVDEVRLPVIKDCEFIISPSRDPNAQEREHIILERGFVDKEGLNV